MQMEVQDLSSASPKHSSKSKMPQSARYYESYTTSGPRRRVESHSYKTHTINSPSTFITPTKKQSRGRATRTNRDGRSRYHSAETEEAETEVSQNENRPLLPLGARLLSDGATWEYIYPAADPTTPATINPQTDTSVTHVYNGDPVPTEVIYSNSGAAPVVDEEAVESDDSAEYDAQAEYSDASGISQPPVTTIVSPAVDWDIGQQPQYPGTCDHPRYAHDGSGNTYLNPKPKYTTARARHKKREAATAPVPKPSLWESFLFPGAYREAMKQGKVRNDRVSEWVQAVAKEVAKEIVQEVAQQSQQYSEPRIYERATAEHGYGHDAEYHTTSAGYGYSRRRGY